MISPPVTVANGDRDPATGRFLGGNRAASGRSDLKQAAAQMCSNRAHLLRAATGEKIRTLGDHLYRTATGQVRGVRPRDRLQAAELLLRYWVGPPPREIPEEKTPAVGTAVQVNLGELAPHPVYVPDEDRPWRKPIEPVEPARP